MKKANDKIKKANRRIYKNWLTPVWNISNSDYTAHYFDAIDKIYQANLAKFTAGISPAAYSTAIFSWMAQLSQSPGRLLDLTLYPTRHFIDSFLKSLCEENERQTRDVRFQSENWQLLPWRFFVTLFLQNEEWWQRATVNVSGLPRHVERTIAFGIRQMLDASSPSNFVLTNPDLFQETIRSGGLNILRGAEIGMRDVLARLSGAPPKGAENFIPGKDVAITPGRVIYKNRLIELIQYEPVTDLVYAEPILILPAWIMKYYILDLSPMNSLVKWLVSKGHTVFIVSWLNPTSKDRALCMDDYINLGAMSAINTICKIMPNTKIHLMGYCLGGTLALITAAYMGRNNDKRLQSLTLIAAQGDFTEAGELMLFISESEVAFLENMMWDQGFLDTKQMAGFFQMLRSYDLIWSKMVQDYMHGKERGMIDLLAWNADATRMPYKMHSEYLEKLFLRNDFAAGRFKTNGKTVVGKNIKVPVFAVSTEKDHVAPWPSVYKIHLIIPGEITFVLATGGHNAGIISPPGNTSKDRSYRILLHKKDASYMGPQRWLNCAAKHKGSWWIAWEKWLAKKSSTKLVPPPKINLSKPKAPGRYVLQK